MKFLLLVFTFILPISLFGQTFNLDASVNNSTQSTCSATLYDSGGPTGQYQNSEDFTISFCSTNGDCMQIDFTAVDLESNYDYLYIYDGPNASSTLLSTINGTINPGTIITSGTCVTIVIHTDGSVQHDGFAATISCTGSCYTPPPPGSNLDVISNGTTLDTCSFTLYDSGGPTGQYQNSEDFSRTFCSTNGDCMQIDFTAVDMESGFDYLYIYDGNSTAAPLLSTLNGTTIPPSIISSGSCITIRITTDGSVQHDGFVATISCTGNCYVPPPPPTNNDPCTADTLAVDTVCNPTTTTNVSATNSTIASPSCAFSYNGGDVWYQATVPASGRLTIELGALTMTDAGIAIYSGIDCNNITEIICDEQTFQMPTPMTITSTMGLAGQTVWIRIWEPGNDNQGTFTICGYEPPPALEVDTTLYTPEELVTDVLITGCLQAMNVTFSGSPNAIGYFQNAFGTGIMQGVILSSGNATDAVGNGDLTFASTNLGMPGDPDLDAIISPDPSQDAAVLEFDFIPSTDTLKFNYIFGSDEYPEYVGSFNDVFAFFLSGPNPAGGNYVSQNIALIPGTTTPVSINNVNFGSNSPPTGPCTNCAYYVDNYSGLIAINYDGITTKLTAQALVIPCETYHIKIAIADAVDHVFDSSVLLEAGSFSSGGNINASHYSSFGVNPNEVYEGCDNYWIFSRVDSTTLGDSLFVDIIVSGTADTTNDVSGVPSSFWILPGEVTDTFYYDAIMDNITEGAEYLVVSVINGCPCSTTLNNDTIWLLDNYDLNPTITPDDHICINNSFNINTSVNPLLDPSLVTYTWSTGDTTNNITVSPLTTTTYTVTITHGCFPDTELSCTLTVIPGIGVNFTASQDTICINDAIDFIFTDTITSTANFLWTFPSGTPAVDSTIGPVNVQWTTSGTFNMTLHVDYQGCVGDTSLTVTVLPQPTITLTPTNVLCNGGNDGEIQTTPGTGIQPFTYIWDDPNTQTTATASNLVSGNYTVTFSDAFGCTNNSSSTITEPSALSVSLQTVDITCFGISDGQINTSTSGGVTPYTFMWSNSSSSSNLSSLPAGNYTVTVTDSNGCTTIESTTLNEPAQALSFSLTTTDVTCNGFSNGDISTVISGGTSPYSYSWDNGITTANNPNLSGGTYCLTATDANGCQVSNCATINEPPLLISTITNTPATCHGYNDGTASLTTNGGTVPYSYVWSNGSLSSVANYLSAGNYSVTITDANGCNLTLSTTIDQPNILVVELPNDYSICNNQQTTITASGTGGTFPYSYQWNTGDNSQSIDVSPLSTTSYMVTITDSHNCTNHTSITIHIYPDLYIDAFSNEDSLCPGEPLVIMANYGGGNGGPYYFYVDGSLVNFPAVLYPQQNYNYTIEIKDDCNYLASDTVSIGIYPIPFVSFSSDVTEGCPPLMVHFTESTNCNSCSYTWDFGDDVNLSFAHTPTHTYTESGIFDVGLSVTTDQGCSNNQTVSNLITIFQSPDAKFTTNPSVISILNPYVHFVNLTTFSTNNYWSFGDGNSSLEFSPFHYFPDTGSFYVVLVAESDQGCLDTAIKTIIVRPENTFWAPTAFSPDNDGSNDFFKVFAYGFDVNSFHMSIFNRWGEEIFVTNDITIGWDGTAYNNKVVQTGIYTWYVTFKNENGIMKEFSGMVNLIK